MLVTPVAAVVTAEFQGSDVVCVAVVEDVVGKAKMFSLASSNVVEQNDIQSSFSKVPQADITANPYLYKGNMERQENMIVVRTRSVHQKQVVQLHNEWYVVTSLRLQPSARWTACQPDNQPSTVNEASNLMTERDHNVAFRPSLHR